MTLAAVFPTCIRALMRLTAPLMMVKGFPAFPALGKVRTEPFGPSHDSAPLVKHIGASV